VENLEQLHDQAARMIAAYGSALAEEFIEGREFTVLVVENPDDPSSPITYHPLECIFPAGETFKHFELKWLDCEEMKFIPCQDSELAERLKEITKKAFIAVKGNGYARCDIRMDGQGELYLLDLNPNCAIYYPPGIATADKILSNHPDGHRCFTEIIFHLARQKKRQTAGEYYAINA
jgi:D-alanine-D-alanine ligase